MRKIAIFSMLIAGFLTGADAATPAQRRGGNASTSTGNTSSGAAKPVSARAATGARTAPRAATPAASNAGANTVVRGRSGTTPTTAAKPVAARAGTTQKVVGTGTKVATAAKNVVVSEECQAKYDGCMDAFCMLDNETGGRCICSDKNAEFDAILAEIERLDQQSYKMATVGVERLEMGDDAAAVLKTAQSVADSIVAENSKVETAVENTKKARRTLDLSLWDTPVDFDVEEDVFGEMSTSNPVMESIEGKEGDALHTAAAKICANQIPECAKEINMLKAIYSQRVRSDCTAYENALKQQKNASAQKLAAAEQALRQTALDQYRSANKYDLGQCTVEFKKCMQTTAGCGDDFSSCASVAAMDNSGVVKSTSGNTKTYKIKGVATTIEISASTYDALMSKKPLCESVTKSCVNVAGQVWDTFLREVAPQLKSAELIAESSKRRDCIGTVAECFREGCMDNIDPNDPDGSFDMCLTRPATMLYACKVELNACNIDATDLESAQDSPIWEFVMARLASMRVDSCTKEVKECIQSEDRCGPDYSNCIGLDVDTVIEMCPYEKLVGCQKQYGGSDVIAADENIYENISNLIQGLLLNIDNSLYTACQDAVDAAVIRVCGDTESCSSLKIDEMLGASTLSYKMCAIADSNNSRQCFSNAEMVPSDMLGVGDSKARVFDGEISGDLPWGSIELVASGEGNNDMKYLKLVGTTTADVLAEIKKIDALIRTTVDSIESDQKVQQCMNGRTVKGSRSTIGSSEAGQFKNITNTVRTTVGNAVLDGVRKNYYKKYDELSLKEAKDIATLAKKISDYDAIDAAHAEELQALEMEKQRLELESQAEIAKINAETEQQAEIDKVPATSEAEVDEAKTEASAANKEACLDSVGDNPVSSGLSSTQTYSVNKKNDVREEVRTAVFNQGANECTLTTKSRTCKNIKKNKKDGERSCKKWNEWVEGTPQTIRF